MKKLLLLLTVTMLSFLMKAQTVNITQQTGWLETAYVKWDALPGVDSYNVYYTGGGLTNKIIDTQLIRSYGAYFRADVLGLAAGSYTIKVAPVTGGIEGAATVSAPVTVKAHDRTGFAHDGGRVPGAYNMNGTLKTNAVVLYITQNTKNTVSLNVTGATANPCVGLQTILDAFKKGNDTRPLAIRLIGNITDLNYMLNGDLVIENRNTTASTITLEGVGSDAVANGWGLRIKSASNVEVRNLAFMLTDAGEGDDVGLQQANDHIWVHNCDLFYGAAGGDADQAKGDGAMDCKKSRFVTFSYNHFWDTGKSNLLGLSENSTVDYYITYHHNWYDHSDSRHPRVRFYSAHVYNNYYDGNSKYGAGSTEGSSIFMEGNYFRNCKYPMLTSKQGTDIFNGAPGTFSNEDGGTIKSFDNFMTGQQRYVSYDPVLYPVEFDAYEVLARGTQVPNTIRSKQGNNAYNNFDTNPALYINSLVIEDPVTAKNTTMTYSGRVSGGDISWAFNDPNDDASFALNVGLKALLTNYTSPMVFVQGEVYTAPSSQTLLVPANNDQTVTPGTAIVPMVFTWGGTATDAAVTVLPASGISFVKNAANKTITVSGIPAADVSFTVTTSGPAGTPVSGSGDIVVSATVNPQGGEIHNFTGSDLSSSFYTFTGANMNSTNGSVVYEGSTLTRRLKIETPTTITYSTPANSTLTMIFDTGFTGRIKLDGTSYTASAVNGVSTVIIPNVPAGSHSITKDNTTNLYYIKTEFAVLSVTEGSVNLKNQDFILYPNPVVDVLNIKSAKNLTVQKVYIFSMTGQKIKEYNGNSKKLDVSSLKSGVYMVNIQTNEGESAYKIIKK